MSALRKPASKARVEPATRMGKTNVSRVPNEPQSPPNPKAAGEVEAKTPKRSIILQPDEVDKLDARGRRRLIDRMTSQGVGVPVKAS